MHVENHIEYTALQPDSTMADIENLCIEAIEYDFTAVCVPPLFVKKAKELTLPTSVKVITVIGYPLGYNVIESKLAEIVLAIVDGADEVEIVINTSALKNKDWQYLAVELNTFMPVIRNKAKKLTVVLETGLMTDEEIVAACDMYGAAGVDYIKAGTGYVVDENIISRIKFIRQHLADAVKIKSAGGIINFKFASKLLEAGVNKISCLNAIELVQEAMQQN